MLRSMGLFGEAESDNKAKLLQHAVRPPRATHGPAEQPGAEHTLRRGMLRLTNPS